MAITLSRIHRTVGTAPLRPALSEAEWGRGSDSFSHRL